MAASSISPPLSRGLMLLARSVTSTESTLPMGSSTRRCFPSLRAKQIRRWLVTAMKSSCGGAPSNRPYLPSSVSQTSSPSSSLIPRTSLCSESMTSMIPNVATEYDLGGGKCSVSRATLSNRFHAAAVRAASQHLPVHLDQPLLRHGPLEKPPLDF